MNQKDSFQDEVTNAPFSRHQATIPQPKNHQKLLAGAAVCILVLIAILGILILRSAKSGDKFRTLEGFPTADFMENYETLLGGRFHLNATVDAELGTKQDRGKLVVFRDSESKKVVPVLVPTEVIPNYALSKSQRYNLVVEVTRSGLLNAVELQKE